MKNRAKIYCICQLLLALLFEVLKEWRHQVWHPQRWVTCQPLLQCHGASRTRKTPSSTILSNYYMFVNLFLKYVQYFLSEKSVLKIPSFKVSKLLEPPVDLPIITKSDSSQTTQESISTQMALQYLPQLATIICKPDRHLKFLSHPLNYLSNVLQNIVQLRDFTEAFFTSKLFSQKSCLTKKHVLKELLDRILPDLIYSERCSPKPCTRLSPSRKPTYPTLKRGK